MNVLCRLTDRLRRFFSPNRLFLFGLLAVTFSIAAPQAHAKDSPLAAEELACLKCHDKAGPGKTLESGETLSLTISTNAFVDSMHKDTSCEDCHDDIDAKTHGKTITPIKSKRDFALSMRESCRTCHAKNFTQYDDSVHAAVIKDGNKEAPLCSDCHNAHTVRSSKIVGPITTTACASCHEDIFKAYAKDVHGLARVANGKTAPICADCHKSHGVLAASLGNGIKDACLTCHEDSINQHKEWLPNAGRHFEAISCPVCHAPTAQRRVNLRLYDNVAMKQVSEKTGVPQFEKLTLAADAKGMGLDERALWSLLKEFNQEGSQGKTVLRGRLEVSSGVEAHQLSEKSKAIKDCNVCHQKGAAPFQSVTLTIAGPDGRPIRHGVQKDVLTSLLATESVRGFYAIGSTRIKLLDYLFLVVMLGAISVPIGHMTIKRLFKGVRDKMEAEKTVARAQADGQDSPPHRRADDDTSK